MRISAVFASALVLLGAQAASAFDIGGVPTEFRGFRIEGNVGGDRFQSEGVHNTKFGYGGTAGFDGVIAERFVIGVEGSYWRPHDGTQNCTSGINGGSVCHRSFEEYGSAVRAGYLVTPKILAFLKAGYVNNRQRKIFDPTSNLFYINGQIVGPEHGYDNHVHSDGFQAGGGVEYSVTDLVYIDAQYTYSGYDDHTARQRALIGVGIRFK